MRYDVGRFRRPMRRSTEGQLASLVSLGDGSTLTLDFTTGQLDPRLTFTRASNATFINSSGLVEWAAANHAPRTNWNFTSPTGSGWNTATTSGTGTFQWVGNGTVIASSGSSGQAFTNITTSTGIAEGLRYVMSVTAQSVTGSPTIQSIFDFTSSSGNTYFKNGATATAGTTVASGDRISVSAVATSTLMNLRMGCGAWFSNRTNESVTLTQFHWHPGSSPVPYYENTATSPRYDSARFDHDPTTLAPRGLLIEAAATNLVTYSPCSTTGWAGLNATGTNNSDTSPENTTTATLWTGGGGGVNRVYSAGFSVTSGSTYTISAYVKKPSSNAARYAKIDVRSAVEVPIGWPTNVVLDLDTGIASGTGYTVTPMQNGWYRIVSTGTVNSTTTARMFLRITNAAGAGITSTNALLWWGAQAEAGSGASSYIPTGASTVQRLADECSMSSTNFAIGSWYTGTQGTLFTDVEYTALSGNQSGIQLTDNSGAFETNRLSIRRNIAIATRANVTARQFSPTATGRAKSAFTYGTADYRFSQNGSTFSAVAGDNGAPPNSIDRMTMFSPGPTQIYGWLRQIKFWPTSLPQATINALTTL